MGRWQPEVRYKLCGSTSHRICCMPPSFFTRNRPYTRELLREVFGHVRTLLHSSTALMDASARSIRAEGTGWNGSAAPPSPRNGTLNKENELSGDPGTSRLHDLHPSPRLVDCQSSSGQGRLELLPCHRIHPRIPLGQVHPGRPLDPRRPEALPFSQGFRFVDRYLLHRNTGWTCRIINVVNSDSYGPLHSASDIIAFCVRKIAMKKYDENK